MTIARDIENTLSRYLSSNSDSSLAGLYTLKTQSGAGTSLSIRTGHDDAGALPDAGFILCHAEDSDFIQPVQGVNLWQGPATIQLRYPSDDYAADADTLASFRHIEEEIERLVAQSDIADKLTEQGEGVHVQGLTEGLQFNSNIEGRCRVAEWRLNLAVSSVGKKI